MGKLERLRAQRQKKEAIAKQARADAADILRLEKAEEAQRAKEDRVAAKRRETQRLCTLGRAFMDLYSRSEANAVLMQRHLNGYISRDIDREILLGTLYAVPEPSRHEPEPSYVQHEPYHE
jgi:hypothetical protein